METYKLHMAVAALAGASLVAVSTYYIHQRTVSDFFEFVKIGTIPDSGRRLSGKRARRKANGSPRKMGEKTAKKAQQKSFPIKMLKPMLVSESIPMPEFSPGNT
ncbi:hypothetical protein MLD38_030982 [Melastoma candidum]|uniref:Uncharacterized protein n=1 Tax=Melastoma candidum TaxID=119954 RepID=A0ACB9MMY4_9MYRT|nr:hypothetical protein MLD38_030982 [Melastoma candidum]